MCKVGLISILLLLGACSGEPRPIAYPGEFHGQGPIAVFVVNHGWHTGLLVQAASAQTKIPQLKEHFGEVPYLEFGWGDRDFYEAEDAGVLLALRAALWPGDTVVHLVAINRSLEGYLSDAGAAKLCVNESELEALLDFLVSSFELTGDGDVIPRGRSHEWDQFYNGAGQYHLANTCNVWTARALQSIGMDLFSPSKLTAGSIMQYLDEHPAAQIWSLSTDLVCP